MIELIAIDWHTFFCALFLGFGLGTGLYGLMWDG